MPHGRTAGWLQNQEPQDEKLLDDLEIEMTDTELLDLIESGAVEANDIARSGTGQWIYWVGGEDRYRKADSIRDCIHKLAEQKEKK